MREKRSPGEGEDYSASGQQGLSISVTANFYVLQQKLMREMRLRSSRVRARLKVDLRVDLFFS